MCQPPGINAANTPQLQTRCMMAPPAARDYTAIQANVVKNVNGLTEGTFMLPNFEFIFGENLTIGGPLPPGNLQDLPFLFCGSGPLDGPGTASPVVGQLDPAPWALPMPDPVFHSTLCPQVAAVGGSSSGGPVVQAQLVPPVINSFTSAGSLIADGKPHQVTLTVTASDPNALPTNMAYSFSSSSLDAAFSCGLCTPTPGTSPVSVNAALTTTTPGPVVFTVTVSNGVAPDTTADVTVNVGAATSKPPIVTKTGSSQLGSIVTLSATAKADNGASPLTISFQQTGGPTVGLSPVTLTGLPPNQTGNATFTVPVSTAPLQFTFVAIATDPTTGLSTTSAAFTVKASVVTSDVVTIKSIAYTSIVSRVGAPSLLGKLQVIATSNETNANPLPTGMTMNATIVSSSIPATVPGSTKLPISLSMVYTQADLPGTLTPTCGATPCWVGLATGVIENTSVTPSTMTYPTLVKVTSSLGGSASMGPSNPLYTIK
jgi:hypothetical protein